jgi:hypothetical protein
MAPETGKHSKERLDDLEEIVTQLALIQTTRVKTIGITTYDGTNTEAWFFRLELEFKEKGIKDPKEKLRILLKNTSNNVLRCILDNKIEERSFLDAKKFICEKFLEKTITKEEFLSMVQGKDERVQFFFERALEGATKLGLDESWAMAVIKKGMKVDLYEKMICLPNSMPISEVKEKCLEFEKLKIQRKSEKEAKVSSYRNNFVEKERYIPAKEIKQGKIAYCNNGGEIATTNIKINGKQVPAIIDSGASHCLMNTRMLEHLGIKGLIIKPKSFRLADGSSMVVKKMVALSFQLNEAVIEQIFYVNEDDNSATIILSKSFSEENKLIHFYENHDILKYNKSDTEVQPLPTKCRIITEKGKVVNKQNYRISHSMSLRVDDALKDLLKKGFIEISRSSWCNPIRPVEKKDGSLRLCLDLRELNKIVEKDAYSLPLIQECLESCKGKKYFTKIDLSEAFYHVEIEKAERFKTAFKVKHQLYQWKRMIMGFKNAPSIFQRAIEQVLSDFIGSACVVYVDDILVFGKTGAEHDLNLEHILERLSTYGIKTNKEKWVYKKSSIEYLGMIVTENSIKPKFDNTEPIRNYPIPKNIKDVQRFLGLMNYYRVFIPACSKITEPLSRLIKKNEKFIWGEEQNIAFRKCKEELLNEKVLRLADFGKPFILYTDASDMAVGCILSQKDNCGNEFVIAYGSRTLKSAEAKYSITEKECLGLVYAIEHFKYYLLGNKFTLITDHIALKYDSMVLLKCHIEIKADMICKIG